jgi:bifunctional isochorismate lyase/aryl carrier protein
MAARYVAQRCGMTLPTQAVVTTLSHSPQDAVMQTLQQQLGELLQQPSDRIGIEENLLDWGLDSLRLMSLVEIWQRQGVQVSFTDLAENPTIATWAQLLARHQTAVHQAKAS